MRREGLAARPEAEAEPAERKRPATTSLMRQLELGFAMCTVGGALVWLVIKGTAVSRHHYEHVEQFRKIIKPGWLPLSTGIDLTDVQWRQYREQAPIIMPLLLACIGVRQSIAPGGDSGAKRVPFTAAWGFAVALVLHGTGAIWLVLALTLNYCLATHLRESALAPAWAWAFALALLFASKAWGEQYWEDLLEHWLGALGRALCTEPSFSGLLGEWLAPLDTLYGGLYKWTRPLNLTILRLISFNIELRNASCRPQAKADGGHADGGPYDGSNAGAGGVRQQHAPTGACTARPTAAAPDDASQPKTAAQQGERGSRRVRGEEPARCPVSGMAATHTLEAEAAGGEGCEGEAVCHAPFTFWIYWSYILYPPLYVAGPIMCYDDFARQMTRTRHEEVLLVACVLACSVAVCPSAATTSLAAPLRCAGHQLDGTLLPRPLPRARSAAPHPAPRWSRCAAAGRGGVVQEQVCSSREGRGGAPLRALTLLGTRDGSKTKPPEHKSRRRKTRSPWA